MYFGEIQISSFQISKERRKFNLFFQQQQKKPSKTDHKKFQKKIFADFSFLQNSKN